MQNTIDNDSIEKHPTLTTGFTQNHIHSSWAKEIEIALAMLEPQYLNTLFQTTHWLPGPEKIFNAFTMPLDQVNYVLFGESPYPRAESANGYAFWDAAVKEIWSPSGLSKAVNRATSLRNIIKMLLIAEGHLTPADTSQEAIANVNKQGLVTTNQEFFNNLLNHGILLLNATPVLQPKNVRKDARAWRPFLRHILSYLLRKNPKVSFILLGNIANEIDELIPGAEVKKFYAEHPYNLSFVTNPKVIEYFKPLHLLRKS